MSQAIQPSPSRVHQTQSELVVQTFRNLSEPLRQIQKLKPLFELSWKVRTLEVIEAEPHHLELSRNLLEIFPTAADCHPVSKCFQNATLGKASFGQAEMLTAAMFENYPSRTDSAGRISSIAYEVTEDPFSDNQDGDVFSPEVICAAVRMTTRDSTFAPSVIEFLGRCRTAKYRFWDALRKTQHIENLHCQARWLLEDAGEIESRPIDEMDRIR